MTRVNVALLFAAVGAALVALSSALEGAIQWDAAAGAILAALSPLFVDRDGDGRIALLDPDDSRGPR